MNRTQSALLTALLVITLTAFTLTGFNTVSASTVTGVIVPLYSYPTSPVWQSLISDHNAYPSVPIIAIINPSSGPGTSPDPNYVQGINALRSAGITVVGYVYTQYSQRSISSAESDINDYHQWYNINGILFDEMSNVAGNENYYSTLSNYAKSLGYTITVGNPGTAVPASYIGTVNILNIYENAGLPSTATLSSNTAGYSSSNFAMVAYDVSSVPESFVASASTYVSYMYITDATLPNPYTVLPSYFLNLLAYLAPGSTGGGPGGTVFTTTSTQTASTTSHGISLSVSQEEMILVVIAAAVTVVAARKI